MKGYVKPAPLIEGRCFICGEKCPDGTYCHFNCAVAYSEAKMKKEKQARELS